ncbi:hypothetical protein HELRODRAFT_76182 [Helobdella robusta]|uniref:Trafficking protein particle complex subunit 5 n=1 Tax=Helobdella robusta TaxID=6412 RepID=T1G2G3_HELRO|nr:hypothetical protein HELRODRAFT_76182 [Helobdella robusta]ESO07809.1 hypothetical protein HELRODRAFT_76182 [Helobdella robusta]
MSLSLKKENKITILDKSLSRGKSEVSISAFALLFSEIVQYCHNRVNTIPELQQKLSDLGFHVGQRYLDLIVLREKGHKRETKLVNMLVFIKSNVWKNLFGKEADKLEHANDDEKIYYIIEKDPLVNRFISNPRRQSSLNCASFMAGIIEAILTTSNFPAKVTAHWHEGTAFRINFDESVLLRDKTVDGRG